MKKSLIAFSLACASAFAFADGDDYSQWQSPWFKAINGNTAVAGITGLSVSNCTWSGLSADNAVVANGKLELELLSSETGVVAVTSAAADTETCQRVKVKAVFTPLSVEGSVNTLPYGTEMDENAQVAFVVAKTNETYKYYAWVGGASAESPTLSVADWVELGAVGDAEAETEVIIDLAYWTNTVTATFTITNNGAVVSLAESTYELTGNALTRAAGQRKISSLAYKGSGVISKTEADFQWGVAKYGERKYGTIDEAIHAVPTDPQPQSADISVLRATEEPVSIPGTGAQINLVDNGNVQGTVTIPAGVTMEIKPSEAEVTEAFSATTGEATFSVKASGDGTVTVVLPDEIAAKKEVVGDPEKVSDGVKVTLQTLASEFQNITLGGKAIGSSDTLRAFLKTCSTGDAGYTSLSPTKAQITTDLEAQDSSPVKLMMWQKYALGLTASEVVSIAPVADVSTAPQSGSGVIVKIPDLAGKTKPYGSPYTVKYKVGDDATQTDASAIKIPETTGHYPVKIVFE